MVTREQVIAVRQKLDEVTDKVKQMKDIVQTALTQYQVGGATKTLPQVDIDGLVADYVTLRNELKVMVNALP